MRKGNTSLRTAGIVVALLGAALLLFRFGVYEQDAAPPAPARPATPVASRPEPAASEAVVLSVSGEVQKAEGGAWASLAAGEKLGANAELRTGKGARTDLRLGAKDTITLSESSDLVIKDLTQEVRRLRLLRGRISVDENDENAPPLRVEDGSGGAAEGRKARFSVLSTGTAIAVATERGQVALTSALHTVSVGAGMESLAMSGQAPAAPRPVSTKVLLQVANALMGASAEVCAQLEGVVPPGAELSVDGIAATPEADSRFHLKVPRARGKKSVVVALRDVSGHTKTREVPCAPSPAEVHDVAIKWKDAP